MTTRFKICCIRDAGEARLAIRYGAHAIGLVSEMPSGPGVIDDEIIPEIAATVPPGVASFLLTARVAADAIVEQHAHARTNALQLVDHVPEPDLRTLRAALPGVSLVPVIHVRGPEALEEARRVAPLADALLLDSGNPSAGELGGTGRTHDWSVSSRIVREVDAPVFLAGGLTPENVTEAIRVVRPYAVDVCSGLRPAGALDEERLREFAAGIASA